MYYSNTTKKTALSPDTLAVIYSLLEYETLVLKVVNLSHTERRRVISRREVNSKPIHFRVEFHRNQLDLIYDGKKQSNSTVKYPGIQSHIMLASSISFHLGKFSWREMPILQ